MNVQTFLNERIGHTEGICRIGSLLMNIHYYGTNDNTPKARMPKIGDRMPTRIRLREMLQELFFFQPGNYIFSKRAWQ